MSTRVNNTYRLIVIGGSAGSFQGTTKILSSLTKDFQIPIILCMHRLKHVRHGFVEALSLKSKIPVMEPYDKQPIRNGQIYLAPSNYHMSIELGNSIALTTDRLLNNSRPSIDIAMESAAYVFKKNMIGILLSGANNDGADGMTQIKKHGGLTIVQDPKDCLIDKMPKSAINATTIDHILSVDKIVEFLKELDFKKTHL